MESSALELAVMTMLMPSYFTSFGVIYISLAVPSRYSAMPCNKIQSFSPKPEVIAPQMDGASRYLQLWVVHAAAGRSLCGLRRSSYGSH